MNFNSLRFKFLAGFIPLFVGSFAVFFAISYYMSSSALTRNTDLLVQEIGKSTSEQLEKLYQQRNSRWSIWPATRLLCMVRGKNG